MGEGREVGGELGGVVVDPRARGQEPGHEGGARGRAERARAIGAVEHDAVAGERLHVRRAGRAVAVDRQERRRHLVGHDEEDVRRVGGHRVVLAVIRARDGGSLAMRRPRIGSSAALLMRGRRLG